MTTAAPTSSSDQVMSPSKFTQATISPRPLQVNTGYYDSKGDFIPAGVLKSPFSGQPFNINEKTGLDRFLKHLLEEYNLVISDIKKIADFQSYVLYWTDRFNNIHSTLPKNEHAISITLGQFCTQIKTNSKGTDLAESKIYFLLSDELEEDRQVRRSIQMQRLEYILSQQEIERQDHTFTGKCYFCKYRVTKGNRSDLILHMTQCHKFQIGHPDNIVFAHEFLAKIKKYFDDITCPYCIKKFKDKTTLVEHMKKKQHRRLDPSNLEFDKYYVINYLEPGKHWTELQEEIKHQEQIEHDLKRAQKLRQRKIIQDQVNNNKRTVIEGVQNQEDAGLNINATAFVPGGTQKKKPVAKKGENDESEDSDGQEDEWEEEPDFSSQYFKCLFSDQYFPTAEACLQHIIDNFGFDLEGMAMEMQLSFYEVMKLINYIRFMSARGSSYTDVIKTLDDSQPWNSIDYLFPTFPDDQLLYSFEARIELRDSTTAEHKNMATAMGIDCDTLIIQEEDVDLDLIRSTSVLKNLVMD